MPMIYNILCVILSINDQDIRDLQKAKIIQPPPYQFIDVTVAPKFPVINLKIPEGLTQEQEARLAEILDLYEFSGNQVSRLCQAHLDWYSQICTKNIEAQIALQASRCSNKEESQKPECSVFSSRVMWGFGLGILSGLFLGAIATTMLTNR